MDTNITGKLNDWTLFTYKKLFGLFSRKAKICWTWKFNASFILSSSTKNCWYYTLILISFCSKERRQLGFVTHNGNLAVNLKPTFPPLLNGKGQFTFLKTKSSHSSGIVMYPPKFGKLWTILLMSKPLTGKLYTHLIQR